MLLPGAPMGTVSSSLEVRTGLFTWAPTGTRDPVFHAQVPAAPGQVLGLSPFWTSLACSSPVATALPEARCGVEGRCRMFTVGRETIVEIRGPGAQKP